MSPIHIADRLGVCSWSLQPSGPGDLIEKVNAVYIKKIQLALDPLVAAPQWSRGVRRVRNLPVFVST